MSQHPFKTSRFASRPVCEGLESRALMSVAGSTLHTSQATANIHALNHHSHYQANAPLLPQLPTTPQITASTQNPSNGDLNPYGVAVIPKGFAKDSGLHPGDILVSNFNNPSNLQGTGTSIVRVTPKGSATLFARTASDTGLTTALGVLSNRFVVVGNLPSTDGTSATATPGSLLILNEFGKVVKEISDPTLINGPWDLTIAQKGSQASIFVSNVESGTITRINVKVPTHGNNIVVTSTAQIASGYANRPDPTAFFVGPTGLAYDAKSDTLYVASTLDNAIYAVKNAGKTQVDRGTGAVVFANQNRLHGPLGLAFAPNGDLIVANGDAVNADPNQPNELVEFTRKGKFVAELSVNPTPGAAFGLAVTATNTGARLSAVDDVLNQLDLFSAGNP
jgi:hypothetical protein